MIQFEGPYWAQRYAEGATGWDAGAITTPLKEYIDQLTDKTQRILIPGAGNAYEAEYLHRQGFSQVTVVDITAQPLHNLQERVPGFPAGQLRQEDFFEHEGTYDLILEQTFWSTFHPTMRDRYAQKMASLLRPGGRLAGVLFEDKLFDDHPPFGGSREDYRPHLARHFDIKVLDRCYNSIPPRADRELWVHLVKLA